MDPRLKILNCYDDLSAYLSIWESLNETQRGFPSFQHFLEAYFEVENDPKADTLYTIAYEQGHAHGYNEVFSCYEDMVGLIRESNKPIETTAEPIETTAPLGYLYFLKDEDNDTILKNPKQNNKNVQWVANLGPDINRAVYNPQIIPDVEESEFLEVFFTDYDKITMIRSLILSLKPKANLNIYSVRASTEYKPVYMLTYPELEAENEDEED